MNICFFTEPPRTQPPTPADGFCVWTTARGTRYFLTTNWAMFQKIFVPLHCPLRTEFIISVCYNFRMLFEYDSWNRVQRIVYPDSEVVSRCC